jgi:hypothetical protein
MFRRKPRIDDALYGKLMTSFGRVVDLDPFMAGPANAVAEKAIAAHLAAVERLDAGLYRGATRYHLRLLAGSWIMARDGNVPAKTADVFEEAVAWRLGKADKQGATLAHATAALARGEVQLDNRPPDS